MNSKYFNNNILFLPDPPPPLTASHICPVVDRGVNLSQQFVSCRSGIIYVLFAFNSWLSPSFVVVFGPRVSMLAAALLYVFYVSQYLYLNTYSVYVATVLVGLAAPVIWTAQVLHLTPHLNLDPLLGVYPHQ